MIAVEDTVLLLLAAGRSQRFGDAGKLDQDLFGTPLGLHAAMALADVRFKARLAVIHGCDVGYADLGFAILRNPDPDRDMASSLRIGVAQACRLSAQAVIVALADMPRVTATHVHRLLDSADTNRAVVASSDGVSPCPPALFGRDRFADLLALTGDHGARALIRAGRHVVADSAELVDVDTRQDLDALRARLS